MIAYTAKGRLPVACVPAGPGAYTAHDVTTGKNYRVDQKFADSLEPKADMIYRPYPNKKIGWKELLTFG